MANKNKDEFPAHPADIVIKTLKNRKKWWDPTLSEYMQDLLVHAKRVVARHNHRKYKHDRTTEDGSLVLPLAVVKEILDRRGFGFDSCMKKWDIIQIQNEVKSCQEAGLAKFRLPAQLVVDILTPPAPRKVYILGTPKPSYHYFDRPIQFEKEFHDIPASVAVPYTCLWDEIYSEEEAVIPGSLKKFAQQPIHSCPHKIAKEDWIQELCLLVKAWFPSALTEHTKSSLASSVKARLDAMVQGGYVNGPTDRFDVYTYVSESTSFITDRFDVYSYVESTVFVTVLDVKRTDHYRILTKDGKNKLRFSIPHHKNNWVQLCNLNGQMCYVDKDAVFGESGRAMVVSDTDPFGTCKIMV